MSTAQLEKHIRALAAEVSNIVITNHARQRMVERGVLRREVIECLRKGRIRQLAEPSMQHGTIECRMEYLLAGRTVVACAALSDDRPGTIVVTVMTRS